MNKREEDKIEEGKEELLKFFKIIKPNIEISKDDFYPLDNKGSSGSIDFKINLDGKEMIIELTAFHRHTDKKGTTLREAEESCPKFANKLNKRMNVNTTHLFGGSLLLKNSHKCPNPNNDKELEEFAKQLSELTEYTFSKNKKAQSIISVEFSNISRKTYKTYEQKYPILMKYLSVITIFIDSVISSWTFSSLSTGSVSEFLNDVCENYIKKKDRKIASYKQNNNFDELWLLIYFGHLFSQITPSFNLLERAIRNDRNFQNTCKQSGFDRIYLHFVLEEKVICITSRGDISLMQKEENFTEKK
jgi:hypothetical protein